MHILTLGRNFICSVLTASVPAFAATEQVELKCIHRPCYEWLPVLKPPPGWQTDRERNLTYYVTFLTLEGQPRHHTEVLIYAQALAKSRFKDARSLDAFIRKVQKNYPNSHPPLVAKPAEPIRTADGKLVQTWRLIPKGYGRWERVAYFEEGDLYMAFTIGAETAEDLARHEHSFEYLLREYRE
jgi:hypothetical protein